jgi:hypothetical protein
MLHVLIVCVFLLVTAPLNIQAEMSAAAGGADLSASAEVETAPPGENKILLPGESSAPDLTSVCLEFSARGKRRMVHYRACAEPGAESDWLWIGDDTGYRDQTLTVIAYGGAEVCLRFTAINSRGRVHDRGWVCSSDGRPSRQLWIGDDTGYRNQNLSIRTDSETAVCVDSTRKGLRGKQRSGWVCSSNLEPSGDNYLGDDTGYRDQRLKIRLAGWQPKG